MTEGDAVWPSIPAEDMGAFHQTADRFLNTANELLGSETPARVGAAFLYASARFNGFAMQVQLNTQGVDAATREKLGEVFEAEISEHMLQRLRNEPPGAVTGRRATGEVLDVLVGLNDLTEADRSAFLKLGDRFIHIANELIGTVEILRVSAAFLHACTRFNAYLLQREGLEPGIRDQDLIADFRQAYSDLLRFHLDQSLIASDGA